MKKSLLFLIIVFKSLEIFSIGTDMLSCPLILSASDISTLSNSVAGSYYQPALIGDGISISHSSPFSLSELNVVNVAYQFSLWKEQFSVGMFALNNKHISDRTIYLGYAKRLLDMIQLGSNLRYYSQKVEGYESLDAMTLNVGVIWENDIFTHGLSYSNVSHTTVKGIELPSIVKYECMISPFERLNFAISAEKEMNFDIRYGVGVSQKITDMFVVYTGFLNNPGQFSAGLALTVNKVEIGYGIRTHKELDWTQAVGIKYSLGKD
jgi:hypothetical protein